LVEPYKNLRHETGAGVIDSQTEICISMSLSRRLFLKTAGIVFGFPAILSAQTIAPLAQ
jgi:hypothetical protein